MPKKLTCSDLKFIAISIMIIDHIANGIFEPMLDITGNEMFLALDIIFRFIGRIGFPIFCYVLVEGYFHTSNHMKHLTRLICFSFLSEIPYDLFHFGRLFCINEQNVFFTLSLGIIAITLIDDVLDREIKHIFKFLLSVVFIVSACYSAYYLNSDFGLYGVLIIVIMFMGKKINKPYAELISWILSCICLLFFSVLEITSFFMVPILLMYNGKKGLKLKYFFYVFYPLHFLIIWILRLLIIKC